MVLQRHVSDWGMPQMDAPGEADYLRVYVSREGTETACSCYTSSDYHPWRNVLDVEIKGTALIEGDTVRIVFGDKSGGAPGSQAQRLEEPSYELRTIVAPRGDDCFHELGRSPELEVTGADPPAWDRGSR